MDVADARRLKQLESGRLKKMLAARDLELEVLKEISAKNWGARRHVDGR
jgi:putative transposase